MSNEMDEDWFGTEPAPVPAPGPTSAPETTSDAPGAKTADDKSMEGKAEEWFSKPSTSTKNGEEAANEDWFAKAPAKKPKADPKKNLAAEVENPPPKIPTLSACQHCCPESFRGYLLNFATWVLFQGKD